MFSHVHFPQKLAPQELDLYLAAGWFRMGQSIFTTNFLNFKEQFYSAIWLRVPLQNLAPDKTQQKVLKRNSAFRVSIKPAHVTAEQEELFTVYRSSVAFEPSASVTSLLYGKALYNIYNTYEVNLYDGDRLIACGFFDIGSTTAAGITSFYDPGYRKYSLGRYLIYLKMDYCRKQGLDYFYPGYFVPGYSFFDYKLEMNRDLLEYLQVATNAWVPINTYSSEHNPLQVMRSRLEELLGLLTQYNLYAELLQYEFFDGNLIPDLSDIDLFDYPVFLKGTDPAPGQLGPWIVYDVRDDLYHVFQCIVIGTPHSPAALPGHYSAHLVRFDEELAAVRTAEEVVAMLV